MGKESNSSSASKAIITHITAASTAQAPIAPRKLAAACTSHLDIDHLFEDETGEESRHAMHWSIPWSDLMMVMFVMFAILFTFKVGEEKKVKEPVPQETSYHLSKTDPIFKEPTFGLVSPQSIYKNSTDAMKAAQLDMVDVVLQKDQTVKVSVQGPMFFDSGKADLKPQTRSFLDALAPIIAKTPYEVHIVGHTDNYPIESEAFPSNWELSAIRATKVARYLIDFGGLEPARFMVSGRSMYKPTVPNISETNKSKNRRVEIVITRNTYTTKHYGVIP
jgi:chemotaxis protein MotB